MRESADIRGQRYFLSSVKHIERKAREKLLSFQGDMNTVNFTEGSEREKERRDRGRERRRESETRGREGKERGRGEREGRGRRERRDRAWWSVDNAIKGRTNRGRRRPTKWADVKGCMVLVAGGVCVVGGGMTRIWQQEREP